MPIHWDKERQCWTFEFSRRVAGRRYRVVKRLPKGWSKSQRDEFERTQSASLYAQATGIEKPALTVAGAVKLYLDHRIPQLRNGKKAAQDLVHLIPLIQHASLHDLSAIATAYDINNRGILAPGTIRNRLAYLRAAITYAYRVHGYGDRNYGDNMVLPTPNNERQIYAKMPELEKLWASFPDAEAAAMFKAAFYMGLRWRNELLPRKPEDIVTNAGETWLVIGKTKNGLPVMKPVHPQALPCLKHMPWSWGERWYYDRWHAAVAKIGRPEMVPHDLRHSVASEILSRGGTLSDVQGALHQVSIRSAQRYAHLYPERLRYIMLGVGGQKVTTTPPVTAIKRALKK